MKNETRSIVGMLQRTRPSRRFLDLVVMLGVVATMSLALGAPPDGKGGGGGKPGGGGGEDPPPSPDIAYINGDSVMLMNFDGSNKRTIYQGFTSGAPNPGLSADGSMVVMMAEISGVRGVFTIRTDGTDLRLVAPIEYSRPDFFRAAFSPVPAPDGEYKIAYNDVDEMGGQDLFVVNLDGSGLQNLTNTTSTAEQYPAWSIDGTRLVARRSGSALMLYELGLDMNGEVVIATETNLAEAGPLVGRGFSWPAWANTQDLIVVSAGGLWLVDPLDPASPTQLTLGDDADRWATFTPDDTRIIFDRQGPKNGIMELDALGNVQKLTKAHPHAPNARRFDPAP